MKKIFKKWWFWSIVVVILLLILPIFPCGVLTYSGGNPSGTAIIAYKNLISIFFLDGCPV